MNIAAAIVLGLLIGWMVEWVLDWFYWRGRNQNITGENLQLQERIASLELENTTLKKAKSRKAVPVRDRGGKDNLQAIKGIGPAFARRLNEAGVHTFEQLSKCSPEDLEAILGTLFKRFFSEKNTIQAQAKEFAQEKPKGK